MDFRKLAHALEKAPWAAHTEEDFEVAVIMEVMDFMDRVWDLATMSAGQGLNDRDSLSHQKLLYLA